jgi:hypothetical protein
MAAARSLPELLALSRRFLFTRHPKTFESTYLPKIKCQQETAGMNFTELFHKIAET